jgi:hypothetical protein
MRPDKVATVFAGGIEALRRTADLLLLLHLRQPRFQRRQAGSMLHRHEISGATTQIAEMLKKAYAEHCAAATGLGPCAGAANCVRPAYWIQMSPATPGEKVKRSRTRKVFYRHGRTTAAPPPPD